MQYSSGARKGRKIMDGTGERNPCSTSQRQRSHREKNRLNSLYQIHIASICQRESRYLPEETSTIFSEWTFAGGNDEVWFRADKKGVCYPNFGKCTTRNPAQEPSQLGYRG